MFEKFNRLMKNWIIGGLRPTFWRYIRLTSFFFAWVTCNYIDQIFFLLVITTIVSLISVTLYYFTDFFLVCITLSPWKVIVSLLVKFLSLRNHGILLLLYYHLLSFFFLAIVFVVFLDQRSFFQRKTAKVKNGYFVDGIFNEEDETSFLFFCFLKV